MSYFKKLMHKVNLLKCQTEINSYWSYLDFSLEKISID